MNFPISVSPGGALKIPFRPGVQGNFICKIDTEAYQVDAL